MEVWADTHEHYKLHLKVRWQTHNAEFSKEIFMLSLTHI